MSDINLFSDTFSVVMIVLIFGSPGLAVGAIIGALSRRAHRIYGALLGAVIGFPLCVGGMWIWIVYLK